MLPAQRTRLIERGHAFSQAADPGTITFPGKPAIAVARRTSPESAALGEGGFEASNVQVFHVLKSLFDPLNVTLTPKKTKFVCAGKTWRLVSSHSEVGEPHLRLVAEIPATK